MTTIRQTAPSDLLPSRIGAFLIKVLAAATATSAHAPARGEEGPDAPYGPESLPTAVRNEIYRRAI